MTLRMTLALTLLSVTPVLAQPAAPSPAPPPVARKMPPPIDSTFETELDGLFTPGGLTADQAAVRAIKVSPSVLRSAAEIEIAIAQAETAELARIPRVAASLGYTRLSYIEPFLFAPGTPGIEFLQNNMAGKAEVGVPISDYVLRFPKLIAAAKAGEEAARVGRRSSEINAAQEARISYYEWVRAHLQVLVARRQLAQVESTLGQIRALAEVQRVSRADLMRVESNQAQAEQAVAQLTQLVALREEQLRLLIDVPDGPLTIGEDIRLDIAAPGAGDLGAQLDTARKQRLDFRALDTGIEAKEQLRAADKASLYPRLQAFVNAEYSNPNPRVFPQEDKFTFTWAAGAQIAWTLNDALVHNSTDRRLRGEVNTLRADRASLDRGARIQVLAAQQAVTIAQSALTTSQKGLAAAEEGYRVRRELLNAERATAVELVDAETDLTRARIAALNARVDLRVALTELAHALGDDAR